MDLLTLIGARQMQRSCLAWPHGMRMSRDLTGSRETCQVFANAYSQLRPVIGLVEVLHIAKNMQDERCNASNTFTMQESYCLTIDVAAKQ
jgi:hypothetical protein